MTISMADLALLIEQQNALKDAISGCARSNADERAYWSDFKMFIDEVLNLRGIADSVEAVQGRFHGRLVDGSIEQQVADLVSRLDAAEGLAANWQRECLTQQSELMMLRDLPMKCSELSAKVKAVEHDRDAARESNRAEYEGHKLTISDRRLELKARDLRIEELEAEVYAVREGSDEWRARAEAAGKERETVCDALNCEPWHYVGMYDEEACFWCAAKRFSRATDEAPHNADCPWATLSPHASAQALRKYQEWLRSDDVE